MLIETCTGQLVLLRDQYIDAVITLPLPAQVAGPMRVSFRTGWVEWTDLTPGCDYFVYPNTPEGADAALAQAIALCINDLTVKQVTLKHWCGGKLVPCTCSQDRR